MNTPVWNEMPYELQFKVMELLCELEKLEDDLEMRNAMKAARNELDCWSNRPIEDDNLVNP